MQQKRQQAVTPLPVEPEATLPTAAPRDLGQIRLIAGADVIDVALAGRTVREAREVARALFGIEPTAAVTVDGQAVDEERVLTVGQEIAFTKRAGQKGAGGPVIELSDDRVAWSRNGKGRGELLLRDLIGRIEGRGPHPERWRLYPPHVRLMVERQDGDVVGVVIEMPPGPREVGWITGGTPDDEDEPAPQSTVRRLSFPWVVLVVVFVRGELCGLHQAFYRPAPVTSLDDPLFLTNLLNVARAYGQESWVCLMNMGGGLRRLSWDDRVRRVTDHFWQAAFNLSGEFNEGHSYWGRRAGLDPRLATAERWEEATRQNPYFALEVQWRRATASLGGTLLSMLDGVSPWRPIERAEQLVTLMQRRPGGRDDAD
jgi:hypothetical protein